MIVVELTVRATVDAQGLTQDWSQEDLAALDRGEEEALDALEDAAVQEAMRHPDDVERDVDLGR